MGFAVATPALSGAPQVIREETDQPSPAQVLLLTSVVILIAVERAIVYCELPVFNVLNEEAATVVVSST